MLQRRCQHVVSVVGVTLLVVSSLLHCRVDIVALAPGTTSLDAVTTCFRVECVVKRKAVAMLEVHHALFRAVSLLCELTVATACVELLSPR